MIETLNTDYYKIQSFRAAFQFSMSILLKRFPILGFIEFTSVIFGNTSLVSLALGKDYVVLGPTFS